MEIFPFIALCTLISSLVLEISTAADTIAADQSITTGKTLVSSGQKFELGFFTPSGSNNRSFLGIWYKNYPQIVVWVANRENPVPDSNGVLTMRSSDGNLVLLDGTKNVIWSSNSSTSLQKQNSSSVAAQILDSGNFVLMDKTDSNPESYMWQSFDYPSDTLLPGMKLGWDSKTGLNRYLTSWKNATDPSPGDFTYKVDIRGLACLVLRKGSEKKFRGRQWSNTQFTSTSSTSYPIIKPITVTNPEEVYYTYGVESNILTRFVVNQSGFIQTFVLQEGSSEWAPMYAVPNDLCDGYGRCGANGICKIDKAPICECLEGFVPKSQPVWAVNDWSGGCVRRTPMNCRKGDGFVVVENVKYPDLLEFWLGKGMNHKECKAECLKNCSCAAYAVVDVNEGGSGCLLLSGNLMDIREVPFGSFQRDIYIRVPASELDKNEKKKKKKKKKMVMIVIVVSAASGMVVLTFLCWLIFFKREKSSPKTKKEDVELRMFDLNTLATATRDFSNTNMLGEGGFGQVYKGKLPFGQEIAVKRLANNSGQGLVEFKNEVLMISRLQHRNLVRLLGCCIAEDERMLIYEYMPNKSLDYFIFAENKRAQLKWPKRFDITMGIARGILYLHQDSRLRIIHRDLKTSNILLDCDLNPKISDFGIARIFGEGQMEAKTKQVIGTYGYMSPEYAIDGTFSVKSDVFSLGVLLLEIVSGQKNRKFHHPHHHHNLLGHAWLLWDQDKALELMDPCLEDSYVESQVLRCIHVGLLCVQKLPDDRPTMPHVVFMLGNEGVTLPQPKQPGFFVERSAIDSDSSANERRHHSVNALTITMLEAR